MPMIGDMPGLTPIRLEKAQKLLSAYVDRIIAMEVPPPAPDETAIALSAASTAARKAAVAKMRDALVDLTKAGPPEESMDSAAWLSELGALFLGMLAQEARLQAPQQINSFGNAVGQHFVSAIYEGYRMTPVIAASASLDPSASTGIH